MTEYVANCFTWYHVSDHYRGMIQIRFKCQHICNYTTCGIWFSRTWKAQFQRHLFSLLGIQSYCNLSTTFTSSKNHTIGSRWNIQNVHAKSLSNECLLSDVCLAPHYTHTGFSPMSYAHLDVDSCCRRGVGETVWEVGTAPGVCRKVQMTAPQ